MNKQNMEHWIRTLRSDQYKQVKGRLKGYRDESRQDVGYCCLGVACDIAEKGKWVNLAYVVPNPNFQKEVNGIVDGLKGLEYAADLPPDVNEWLGFGRGNRDVGVYVEIDGKPKHVATLNDEDDFTFKQIADALESTYINTDRTDEELNYFALSGYWE